MTKNKMFQKSKQKKMKGGAGLYDAGALVVSGVSAVGKDTYNAVQDFFVRLTSQNKEDAPFRQCIIRYIVMTAIVIGICIGVFKITQNPENATHQIDKYYFVIALPLVLVFAILFNIGKSDDGTQSGTSAFFKIGGVLLLLGILVYFYSQSRGGGLNIPSIYQNYAFIILISLVGLSIIYHTLSEYITRLPGWMGFVGQLIFYIPCMFYDAWTYVFEESKITPASIYVLIALEIFLVIMYIYLPRITDSVTGLDNGKQLLVNPVLLNTSTQVLATSDDLKVPQTNWQMTNGINADQYRTNYCISMWVYVNTQNGSTKGYTKESEIFSYGYKDPSGVQHVKPMIRYYGGVGNSTDSIAERDKFIFYFSTYPPVSQYDTSGDTFYDVSVPTQKWNQFVLNYNRNTVDLYINGSLERSFSTASSLPVYNDLDQITIGDKNGIQGSICNVSFYNHPLSLQQITYSYNMSQSQNPPIGLGATMYNKLTIPPTSSP
jgi:Concanavalin A-like lectin/glucanases superfamily